MINTGISFGWFTGISVWVPVFFLLLLLVLAVKTRELWGRVGMWLMIIGGAGNLWSRIRYGGVVDNLQFGSMLYNNLADYLIFFGLVIYGYTYFVRGRAHRRG